MAMPLWLGQKLWMADEIQKELGVNTKILFGDHHESHAASAFYPSPFEESAILTIDGVGEWTTSSIAHGDGARLTILRQTRFPHSLGLLYSGFERLFGGPGRSADSPVTQREMDLARSLQEVTEEVMLRMGRTAHRETGSRRLCLAGGVALNCVANGRLLREGLSRISGSSRQLEMPAGRSV
jgi:predicted NodU family carbamoyl transferase